MNKKTKYSTIFILGITLLSTILIYFPTKETFSVQTISQLVNAKPTNTPGKGGGNNGGGNNKPVDVAYELFIEIDYMEGHEPNQLVLDYIISYYISRGINVEIHKDDIVEYDESITDGEFWAIETAYNDHDNGYYDNWKWVLFGTIDGSYGSMGYTWANDETGNYIFIADQSGDEYALNLASQGVTDLEVEAVVLMHELGHSIGILKLANGAEVYDRDFTSVMSWLNPENCNEVDKKDNPDWHYSKTYWKLKNLEYYAI